MKTTNKVRIIAGNWRGRNIHFPDVSGLRPTPNSVRETLFNWLRQDIGDSNCLDLFAGSGALGFEAISRGAAHVTFVDNSVKVYKQLQHNCEMLEVKNGKVYLADAIHYLQYVQETFDIIFLDPPFNKKVFNDICKVLNERQLLKINGYVYIESSFYSHEKICLPNGWEIIRSKKTGKVLYNLIKYFGC